MSLNINGIREGSTKNFTKNENFLEVCKEAIRLNPGMKQLVEQAKLSKPMKMGEVLNCIRKARKGSKVALDMIVRTYMPHALKKAVYYCKLLGAENMLDDICQEFFLTIQKVVMTSDLSVDSNLSALLGVYFERSAINTIFCNGDGKYNIPVKLSIDLFTIKNYLNKNGYTTEDQDEIVDFCKRNFKCNDDKAMIYSMLLHEPVALENIEGAYEEEVERKIDNEILKEKISKFLDRLNEREKFVLENRFGLNNWEELTLEEIGKKLEVTRERVRQIESKALGKIRAHCKMTSDEFEWCCAA